MNIAYLLIGGNIGNRVANLQAAREAIAARCGALKGISDVYETAAWGMEEQPHFLNQALELHTEMEPKELLDVLLQIEKSLGRERDGKWGPRLIDIDILLYNDEVVNEEGLRIPHPQMPYRRFVLQPLVQIAGDKIHPLLHQSIYEMLLHCPDSLEVHKFN
ncbi:MAG: 2-amino-4-hydroxy-6-hydroxymethyldihydropteridine diphosphokinase [Chitinophagaceae bacterium]